MMALLSKLGESILSKLSEKLVDFGFSHKDNAILESLQSNMRSLRAIALDIDDEVMKAELRSKKKRKRQVKDWFEQIQTVENDFRTLQNIMQMEGLFVRHFFSEGRAAKLDAKVHQLIEQSRNFGELVLDADDTKGVTLLTNGLVGDEFHKNLDRILMLLDDENTSIIGIHGMGGVGKTLLAKHVNNRLLERTQKHVVWITISQESTINTLQEKISKAIGISISDEDNEDKRASRLNKALWKRKNIVFIFDDVWKDMDLKKLGDPLSVDGCKLLLTTRLEKVCCQLHCKQVIKVKKLKNDEAWNLFKETLGQMTNLTHEVQKIAISMVDQCDGLPLGVITLAGSMRGQSSIHVWHDALMKLREQDIEENVFMVLKHSFEWLGQCEGKTNGYSESQLCFLYCSHFREDFPIQREELIMRFIQEGFLRKRSSRKAMFIQGHAILDKLVDACLLERGVIRDYDVKMHDLMREMALKIVRGKHHFSFKGMPSEEEWSKDLEKMYLSSKGISEIPSNMSPYCPNLYTLLLDGNPLKEIPDSFFLQMSGLGILDLTNTNIKQLPNSLSNMVNLEVLLLKYCWELEYIPYLGNLKKLRELNLHGTAIEEVPQGMQELSNLKLLSLLACDKLKILPEDLLSKFTYLQWLLLPYHIQAPLKEIEKLKYLEMICGQVKDASILNKLISRKDLSYGIKMGLDVGFCYHLRKSHNQLKFSTFDFNNVTVFTKDIQHLNLGYCKGISSCFVEFLSKLSINPASMKTLIINVCVEIVCLSSTERFPDRGSLSSTSMSVPSPPPHAIFSSLSVLKIFGCGKIKRLGLSASQLQNLTLLSIDSCEMIEEIVEMTNGNGRGESGEEMVVSLPKLEYLWLTKLPRLRSICDAKMVCSSIYRITLGRCEELKKFPLVFGQPNYDTPPHALREIQLWETEKEWWEKLEMGCTIHHSLLQPFVMFVEEVELLRS